MDKLVTVGIVIGLIVVGGIGVFSISLQEDEAVSKIERIINPNLHCLDKWDYFIGQQLVDPNYKTSEKIQSIMSEFRDVRCNDSFRTWMPESHVDWNEFVNRENNLRGNCELYVKGELLLKEHEKLIWKEKGCEDFLKQFD